MYLYKIHPRNAIFKNLYRVYKVFEDINYSGCYCTLLSSIYLVIGTIILADTQFMQEMKLHVIIVALKIEHTDLEISLFS